MAATGRKCLGDINALKTSEGSIRSSFSPFTHAYCAHGGQLFRPRLKHGLLKKDWNDSKCQLHPLHKHRSRSSIRAGWFAPKRSVVPVGTESWESKSEVATTSQGEGDQQSTAQLNLTVSVITDISKVSPEDWDACALEAAGEGARNPFLSHAFLLSLEESKSAVKEEGWLPQHVVARDDTGAVLGVVPMYLKGHSQGEYVFDHSWASAHHRYGVPYYPKLQSCVPFTPATGPRLLVRHGPHSEVVSAGLCQAMVQLADTMGVSSLHCTFPVQRDWDTMGKQGFLRRVGVQYHWLNRDYDSFDAFLMDFRSSKRASVRKERKKVREQNVKLLRLRGDDIKPIHWDAFYQFYRNTTDMKWGTPYLTRDFFHLLGERMADDVLLVMAEDDGELVGGALNLIGGDTLFGRNWGCDGRRHYPNLHFEACYYQAIEAAIEMKLKRVEAGAQGEHKIQRGYLPTPTFSAHYIRDPNFRRAVSDFLRREMAQMAMTMEVLDEHSPFNANVDVAKGSAALIDTILGT
ncbi:hypothetical protein KFL_001140120 [Klebsormidium nitens]|uniref:Acyl-CoA N-acyltransferase n=1 Tax=Klebsormidium nitens TaxID=105231 RepID=A0A1Y1HV68_KLENI|nr:hypothetical protein KFL_001140120 [Klebsormidium nitens]|eukprot:GAQ82524.1 hypothetical protein KFL_001140120 [Klebsormidium nitens]